MKINSNNVLIYSMIPVDVFMDDRLTKTDIRVLGALLSFREKSANICWPTREKLASRCNLPLCKISTSTSHLVELGWLQKTGDGGKSSPSKYEFLIPFLGKSNNETQKKCVKNAPKNDVFLPEKVTDLVTVSIGQTVTDLVTVSRGEKVTDSVTFFNDSKDPNGYQFGNPAPYRFGNPPLTDSVRGKEQTIEQTIKIKRKKICEIVDLKIDDDFEKKINNDFEKKKSSENFCEDRYEQNDIQGARVEARKEGGIVEEAKQQRENLTAKAEIIVIFEFWKATMGHGQAKLDAKREKFIRNALALGYTADDLQQAILGCSKTPHNMGQNANGKRYDGIDLIFRSADHIDRFIGNLASNVASGRYSPQVSRNSSTRPTYRYPSTSGDVIDSTAETCYELTRI